MPMTSLQKAWWLGKANPYKQPYMQDAFRMGAQAFWTGTMPEYRGNSRERAAFTKGYLAAQAEAPPQDPGYYVIAGQTDFV